MLLPVVRRMAMKKRGEAFIGINAAKARNAVAIAEEGRDGEIRYHSAQVYSLGAAPFPGGAHRRAAPAHPGEVLVWCLGPAVAEHLAGVRRLSAGLCRVPAHRR